jgi:hypothetical protein
MTNWPIKREFGEQIIGSGGKITVESGGEVDFETGASLSMGGVAVTPGAAALNSMVSGIAAGYRVARGRHETLAAVETIATGLTTVVAAFVCFEDAPTVNQLLATADVGDQAGAPAAGSIILKTFKPTAVDNVTPAAATVFGAFLYWLAIGT